MSDREEDDRENSSFGTPRSSQSVQSPVLKSAVGISSSLQKPRTLTRSGAKKNVRQLTHFKPRLLEMKRRELTPECSFFVSAWANEFNDAEELSKEADPSENVQIMLKRVLMTYRFCKLNFDHVSGVYIGKSANLRVRFNGHYKRKTRPDEAIVILTVATFTEDDVPEVDRDRWAMNAEVLALNYERLLMQAVLLSGTPTYDDTKEEGGGGRSSGKENVKECAVYMLLSLSNAKV